MLFKNDKYLIMVVCMLVLALIENILEAKPSLQNRDISFSFDYSSLDINVGSDSVGSFDGKIKIFLKIILLLRLYGALILFQNIGHHPSV